MLEELSVRDYALIDSLSLSFEGGLSILTGETGAGKSIIVGALGFLLGAKADSAVIRGGAEEASVSAILSVNNADALRWLAERGIEPDEGRVSVRRVIRATGRGSAWIQGTPAVRGDLAAFMSFMFDIHGQHTHQALLGRDSQRRSLDTFAGLEEEARAFNRLFAEAADRRRRLANSETSERDREAKAELLAFSIEEIDKARLRSGESRELEAESARLAAFEKLSANTAAACRAFFDDEASAVGLLRHAKAGLDAAAALDGTLAELQQRVDALYYEAEDVAASLRGYRDALTFDPQRLAEVGERLALIQRLKRKYARDWNDTSVGNASVEDAIVSYRDKAAAELEAISNADEDKERQRRELAKLEAELTERAAALGAKRREAGDRLSGLVSGILASLGMPDAVFSVSLQARGPQSGDADASAGAPAFGPWGAEDAEFLIRANKGEEARELRLVASGGELSRVMLAIKTALIGSANGSANADQSDADRSDAAQSDADRSDDGAETLIFDEIDAGVGGEAAIAVGEYLQKIGGVKQIFCVTHLAAIACRARNHLKVEKREADGRTLTRVSSLTYEERRQEIARMLAGGKDGTALAHAEELLKNRQGQ